MAGSLTEILAANNQAPTQGVDVAGNISSGVQAGMQLASAADQLEANKTKLADQKLELQTKQATSMMNRTKAAMFAGSDATFNSIMDSNKAYANSINIPYNDEALRAAYKDQNLRLAAQKEINTVLNAGVSKNPQAIVDYFGSDSPTILQHLQDASYTNAQVKEKQAFESQKQQEQIQAMKAVAGIKADATMAGQDKRVASGNDRLLPQANRAYQKEVVPLQELILTADKTNAIIDDIRSGKVTSNPNIKADIEDNLSKLSSGKGQTTVSGSARHEIDSLYGKIQRGLNNISGEANDTVAPKQLDELSRDVKAFQDLISKQHEVAFNSFIAKQPNGVQAKMTEGYNRFRQGYGLSGYGVDSGAPRAIQTPRQAAAAPSVSDPDIQAALKSLPPGANPELAAQALLKAKMNKTAGK